jgi:hypothetical protein
MRTRSQSIDARGWEREHLAEGRRILRTLAWATAILIAAVFVLFVVIDSQPSTYQQQIAAHPDWADRSVAGAM